ncbi:unnamed protein product [Prunus brigantina]
MTAYTYYSPKQMWIVDSGVSHHMVSDVSRLNNATHCDSVKQVTVERRAVEDYGYHSRGSVCELMGPTMPIGTKTITQAANTPNCIDPIISTPSAPDGHSWFKLRGQGLLA